ncbi:hypothetical protein B566_EDAN007271 [Ephemera danica]|nr:hypothetical protein B566_EDAN007271 [Ephemera danica]
MKTKILVFLCWLLHRGTWGLPNTILLGGLLDSADKQQTVSFRNAVERINDDKSLLPRSRLVAQLENISPDDSFHTSKRACHLLKLNGGVAAILGPQTSASTINHVQSICDALQVPHLETRWDPLLRTQSCRINLYPHSDTLSRVGTQKYRCRGLLDSADKQQTVSFRNAVERINDDKSLLPRSRLVAQLENISPDDSFHTSKRACHLLKLNGGVAAILGPQTSASTINHVQSICDALQVPHLETRWDPLLRTQSCRINLYPHSDTLSRTFKEAKAIIIIAYLELVRAWGWKSFTIIHENNDGLIRLQSLFTPRDFQITTVKLDDQIDLRPALKFIDTNIVLDCARERIHDVLTQAQQDLHTIDLNDFQYGNSDIRAFSIMQMRGLTGEIKLDENGFRSNFELSIVKLKTDGLKEIGTWSAGAGIQLADVEEDALQAINNKTLGPPFLMLKESSEMLSGNDRFEGYISDLVEELSKLLGFNYEIHLVPDGAYGVLNQNTGEWNGMIKELLGERADLAVSDLTITAQREQVVDFSMPYMTVGIGILYRRPVKIEESLLFSFLTPLELNVLSPCEGSNPDCDIPDEAPRENKLTIWNSLWFTTGSALHQSSNIQPKSFSTRLLAGIWWLFTLVVLCMYTANLAAFFVSGRMDMTVMMSPIASAEDLANPSVFVNTNQEGVERVLTSRGKYAFLMESSSMDFIIERYCELARIGGLLDSKGFGFAMPKNSPFRSAINSAILKLQETSKLASLKTLWWSSKRGGGMCATPLMTEMAHELRQVVKNRSSASTRPANHTWDTSTDSQQRRARSHPRCQVALEPKVLQTLCDLWRNSYGCKRACNRSRQCEMSNLAHARL